VKTKLKEKEFTGKKVKVVVFNALCKGCGVCIERCPKDAISWSEDLGVYGTPGVMVDMEKCTGCGLCETFCPDCAIAVIREK